MLLSQQLVDTNKHITASEPCSQSRPEVRTSVGPTPVCGCEPRNASVEAAGQKAGRGLRMPCMYEHSQKAGRGLCTLCLYERDRKEGCGLRMLCMCEHDREAGRGLCMLCMYEHCQETTKARGQCVSPYATTLARLPESAVSTACCEGARSCVPNAAGR